MKTLHAPARLESGTRIPIILSGCGDTVASVRNIEIGRDIVSAINFHGALVGEVNALGTVANELLMYVERGTFPQSAQITETYRTVILRSVKLLNAIEAATS